MADKIEINGRTHINTAEAANRLQITTKRVLDYVAEGKIEAVYLNGYYIPEAELQKLTQRKPGRPKSTKKPKTAK